MGSAMRFIVSVGWSIYPLGYFFGYLCGAVAPATLNLIYNLADFVNKIAFAWSFGTPPRRRPSPRRKRSSIRERLTTNFSLVPRRLSVRRDKHRFSCQIFVSAFTK